MEAGDVAEESIAQAEEEERNVAAEPEESPLVSPAQFPPPNVEMTYPAAIIQFAEGNFQGNKAVIMSVVAPDEDGVVRTRHYPMSEKFAGNLEGQLREARGVSDLIVAGADQLPEGAKA